MEKGISTTRCIPATRTPELVKAKDLRRRHGREAAEALVSRATWLPDSERQLVLAVFEEGKSVVDLASLMKQPVRTLRTRVRRLVDRITSPIFAFVALNLEQWPVNLKRVADACVCRGLTIKEASAELRMSYYNVRRHLDLIRTMLETGNPGGPSGPATLRLAGTRRHDSSAASSGGALDERHLDEEDDAPSKRFEHDEFFDPDTDLCERKAVHRSRAATGNLHRR